MTKSVGVHEAKTHLSQLLNLVAGGEEVSITRRGTVVARLVPPSTRGRRVLGAHAGMYVVPDDFDAPLDDELLEEFDG